MAPPERLICDLKHGIQLTMWNTSEELTIQSVMDFLAEAMRDFKRLRAAAPAAIYARRNYRRCIIDECGVVARIALSCAAKVRATRAMWVEAVVHGFSYASAIEQLVEHKEDWRARVEREGGYMLELLGLVDQPGGDLLAFVSYLQRPIRAPAPIGKTLICDEESTDAPSRRTKVPRH